MKIFGDDGFRDKYGKGLMSEIFLNNFFRSLNIILKKKKINSVIIGFDTRKSNEEIRRIIISNLFDVKKIHIINKPVTTPYIHFLSKNTKSFCIMITASHFEWNYNGFKFFYKGEKISKVFENQIIKNLNKKKIERKIKKKISFIYPKNYFNFINKKFNIIIKKKIILDLANGGACSFINQINFLKKLNKINYNFDGKNINKNAGSNFIKKNFRKRNFEYLIAFDGDADRVSIAKKGYGIIETEKLALIFAEYLLRYKKINKENIVGTIITNPWLEEELKKIKIKLLKTKVGDRNVTEKEKKNFSLFSFETSGHFSFNKMMDGIYASALFLKIIQNNENIVNEILKKKINYKKYILKVIPRNKKLIINIIKKYKENKKIKIIKRKSIWENLYKVYFFYKKEEVKKIIKIKNYIYDLK